MGKDPKGKYLYGHVIAATCFGIQAVGIGTYFSYGVLFNPLIDEFGWSRASIAGAASLAFLWGVCVLAFLNGNHFIAGGFITDNFLNVKNENRDKKY